MSCTTRKFIFPFLHKIQRKNVCFSNQCNFYYVNLMYPYSNYILHRTFSSENKKDESLVKTSSSNSEVSTTVLHKVKETTKTASYMGVIVLGVGLTGVIFYTIFKELFSSNSPNSIYTQTLKRCCNETRVTDKIGDNIKGFGDETRRGRRHRVSSLFFERDGIEHLRMVFYIQGSRKKATVNLEMRKTDSGNFEYRYLYIRLDDYPHEVIILEDNRFPNTLPGVPSPSFDLDLSNV